MKRKGEGEGEGEDEDVNEEEDQDNGEGGPEKEEGGEGEEESKVEKLSEEEIDAKEAAARWALAIKRVCAPKERAFIEGLAGLRLALPAAQTSLLIWAARTVGLQLDGTSADASAGAGSERPEGAAPDAGSGANEAEGSGSSDAQQLLQWQALQPQLGSGAFFAAIEAYDAKDTAAAAGADNDAESSGAVSAAALRTMLGEQDAEALQNENVAFAALQMWLDEAANQLEQAEQRVAEARRLREEEAAAAAEAAAQAEAQAEGTGGDGDNEGADE